MQVNDKVAEFMEKTKKTFFATISGCDGNDFSDLKRMGLSFQKVTGLCTDYKDNAFLVWNTQYSWEQFQQIMFKLNKMFRQWGICIGREVEGKYDIALYMTDDLDNIDYKVKSTFTSDNVIYALEKYATMLARKIYVDVGEVAPNKDKVSINLGKMQERVCAASSSSMIGCYVRRELVKELLNN